MYRIKNTKNGAYLYDYNLVTHFWHKTEYVVFPTQKHLFKHLKKVGTKQGWPHFDDFPEFWEVQELTLSKTKSLPFRKAMLDFNLTDERRYRYAFRTAKRKQKAAEESLNIC